ncbi:unnamed protein product [Miscanthus lutarioriparius]|uniref:Uncharacterized protein n=1 Tax=Miscanthus lutarioriparius TaxID=422564 RepID=A0A811MMI4_9POAL|nr:unnamed protein product [Miscanthus lutarioriparius]
MVKFTVEELRAVVDKGNKICNMSVIAHVDHVEPGAHDPILVEPAVANLKRGGATWKDIVILVEGAIILVQALVIVILLSNLM